MRSYPLLQSQLEIFWGWSTRPTSTAYNLPSVMPFPLSVDAARLQAALEQVFATRRVLHTRFRMEDGHPRQFTAPHQQPPIRRRSLPEAAAKAYMYEAFVQPFDLFGTSPLCRFEILTTESHHYLLSDFHHSIVDGLTISQLLLRRDLAQAYQGLPLEPDEPLPWLFRQAEAEQASFHTETYRQASRHVCEQFQGLPFTTLAAPVADGWGTTVSATRQTDKTAADSFCLQHGISAHQLFLGAYAIVLSRLSRQSSVAFFTLAHGRKNRQLRNAYGMFVQSLPLLVSPSDDAPALTFLQHLHRILLAAHRHSCYPATHLCRDRHLHPATTFAFQGERIQENVMLTPDHPATNANGWQLPHGDIRSDLSCMVYVSQDAYEIRVDSSERLNSQAVVDLVAQAVATCVQSLMSHPHQPVASISLASDTEQAQLLTLGQGEAIAYDPTVTVADRIVDQARRTPQATAVVDEAGSISYEELDQQSAALSARLRQTPEAPFVALLTGREKAFLIGVLGCWRAAKGYVPLDTENPLQRNRTILTDSESRILLTTHAVFDAQLTAGMAMEVLFLDDLIPSGIPISPPTAPRHTSPTTPAYMIYTSGSTGTPKGVVISHGALNHFVHAISHLWQLTASSRIGCHASLAFDASVEDLFPVLAQGGQLYIIPDKTRHDLRLLDDYLHRHRITGGCYTTRFGLLLSRNRQLPMDYLCLGGERLTEHPGTNIPHIYNTYGPTEFTVDATWYELPPHPRSGNIPIGRPLPGLQAYVTDPCGQLLPRGAVGELWLGGPQMATGYWKQPQLTSERFTPCRFTSGKVYHTGDLVRWNADGQLEYVGRADGQLKLRGYRVEPAEIEQALQAVNGVQQAVVVVHTAEGQPQLHAYFTARQTIAPTPLKQQLQRFLPAYMIPQRLMQLDAIPVLPSGKTDFNRLPAIPDEEPIRHESPANDTEREICEVFAHVLEKPQVGPTDDFFALGGTSLTVMLLLGEAEKHGIRLHYGDVFRWPTPRELGRREAGSRRKEAGERRQEKGYRRPESGERKRNTERPSPRKVLLTGATGFLGCHLLREMMRQKDWKVWCLIRGEAGKTPHQRLQERLKHYFGNDFEDWSEHRITIVEGDVTDEAWQQSLLTVPIDTVVHAAAIVKHYAAGSLLEEVNVGGTQRMVDFCVAKGAQLTHISTASTLLQKAGIPYVASKRKAEQVVADAMTRHHLCAQILQVGNLSARRGDGMFQQNAHDNGFMALLRACVLLGCHPQTAVRHRIDLSPVDETAHAVVQLMQEGNETAGRKILMGQLVSLGRVFEALQAIGLRTTEVTDTAFAEAVQAAAKKAENARWLVPLAAYSGWLSDKEGSVDYGTACTHEPYDCSSVPVVPSSVQWTALTDTYLRLFLHRLYRNGFFNPNHS